MVFDLVGYFFISLSLSAICRKGKEEKKMQSMFWCWVLSSKSIGYPFALEGER